jgi:DNA topoisomerase-1
MESELDLIENGELELGSLLHTFWDDFKGELDQAEQQIQPGSYELPVEKTDIICDKCGATMIVKNGRFGKFAACPNYPTCKNTKPLTDPATSAESSDGEKTAPTVADFKCELCGADMVLRNGKFGAFYACENFPKCKFTKQITKDTGIPCPKCGGSIVAKRGKSGIFFFSCEKYPECDFSTWDQPIKDACPDCGGILLLKKGKRIAYCYNKEECGYSAPYEAEDDEQ